MFYCLVQSEAGSPGRPPAPPSAAAVPPPAPTLPLVQAWVPPPPYEMPQGVWGWRGLCAGPAHNPGSPP
eukprot:1155735-Pelagomonas_calceolata.AAC.17